MTLTMQTDPIPLRIDEYGVVRVGDSQVLLDIVIREFNNGAEPETIANSYPTLDLADVYGVIAYYLRHRKDVDDYLATRREEAEKLRQEIEAKQPSRVELRAKLLARKAETVTTEKSIDDIIKDINDWAEAEGRYTDKPFWEVPCAEGSIRDVPMTPEAEARMAFLRALIIELETKQK